MLTERQAVLGEWREMRPERVAGPVARSEFRPRGHQRASGWAVVWSDPVTSSDPSGCHWRVVQWETRVEVQRFSRDRMAVAQRPAWSQ